MNIEKMNSVSPEGKSSEPSLELLAEVEANFLAAENEFNKTAPNFFEIEKCIEEIRKETNAYEEDFTVILREKEEYGGGLEQQKNRIESMKNALPELKNLVAEAESLITANESLYSPYQAQIDAAKKMVEALEKI